MRRAFFACLAVASVAVADNGLPPRASSSDYPVHQSSPIATFAAAIVPAEVIKKVFSGETGNKWVVVEVGIYPQDGHTLAVDSFDFALKVGEDLVRPGTPDDVANPWADKGGSFPGRGPRVTTDAGVVYSTQRDPVYGRTHSVGTYTGVGVDSGGASNAPPPPAPSGPDPAVVAGKARDRALPQGSVNHPVAGYLYFPISPKKLKNGSPDLTYVKDDVAVHLLLPVK